MDAADLKQIEALIQDRVLGMLQSMDEAARWYTSGYSDHTESAALLVKDVIGKTVSDLTADPEPVNPFAHDSVREVVAQATPTPEPVNPFAPKRTAQEWADTINAVCQQAKADGYSVWFDTSGDVAGNAWLGLRVGTETSPIEEDPLVWENR